MSELFPHALYHFEDFGPSNARRILDDNAGTYRIFNDDVQGTGAIVLASVISALKVTRQSFRDQRLVVFGSGTAGCGIADALRNAMIHDGASREEAISRSGWWTSRACSPTTWPTCGTTSSPTPGRRPRSRRGGSTAPSTY